MQSICTVAPVKYTEMELYDFARLDGSLELMDSKGRRQSGLHVSGLVKAAYKGTFHNEPKSIEGAQPFIRQTMGFLWERAIEHAFTEYMQAARKQKLYQAALECALPDGRIVRGTPDGIMDGAIEEYKATWRSKRKWSEDPEAEFWMWFAQTKAYCHMGGYSVARFFVFWVNGDYSYKTGRGPQVTTCEIEFTADELEDNWRMLTAYAGQAKEEVHE